MRNLKVSLLLSLLATLTFIHNSDVAQETKFRQLNYDAWVAITGTNFFQGVRNRDAFISNTSNDAYEVNAGSFYLRTKKRLTYIFNSGILWPEIASCGKSRRDSCSADKLPSAIERILATIPNLNRDKNMTPRNTLEGDWVVQLMKPGALSDSKSWIFELFLMTPKTALVFLAPVIDSESFPRVSINNARLATVTHLSSPEFRPQVVTNCFEKSSTIQSRNGLQITFWTPSTDSEFMNKALDFRDLYVGSC